MNRRDFVTASVAGAGIGVAGGCLSSMRGSIPVRRITGVEADASSPDVDVRGEVLQSTISADEQGKVRLRFEWNGNGSQVFGFGNAVPVSDPTLGSTPDGAVLTGDSSPEMRRDDETWLLEAVPWSSLEYYRPDIEPSEELAGDYYLWVDPEHLDYIEENDYAIRTDVCRVRQNGREVGNRCETIETTYTIVVREEE